LLLFAICASAHIDTLEFVTPQDSLAISAQQDSLTLTSQAPKKDNIFKRAYRFLDRIFSPPRDTTYIEIQDFYNWCAEVQLTNRFEMYEIDNGSDFFLRVAPKIRTRVGPFFGWRFAFFGYNIDIKSIFNHDDIDLAGSIYSSAFGLDLFYRRVGGNYNIKRLIMNDVNYSADLHDLPFDGINVGMTRINFYYVTNYKKYSHQAAFSQTNRQLKSAGSLLLGAAYAHNRITVDWDRLTNIINTTHGTNLPTNAVTGTQKNDEITLTAGYGYNWVFSRNWLAAGELTGGIGALFHKADSQKPESSSDIFKSINNFANSYLAFNANARIAILWNNGPWFSGVQGVFFYYQSGNGKVVNRNILGTTYVFLGFNF
jgi:hypothetical protein